MLAEIVKASASPHRLAIVDCRPLVNAMANAAKGAGYEFADSYTECDIEFASIENIHAMRTSLKKLQAVLEQSVIDTPKFLEQLSDTRWLEYLSSIISTASR